MKLAHFLYFGLFACGAYAVIQPNLSGQIPCVISCDEANQDSLNQDLLNKDKAIASLLNLSQIDKTAITIIVEKSKYRLTVYYQNKPIKAYAIALGGNPKDDKLRQGDKRTPEGKFRVRELYHHDLWSKFVWIDYPTVDSWRKHNLAKTRGEIGEFDSIGGEIGIHGVENGQDWLIDRRINWTLGCVSLKNKDINEIYPLLQRGTAIEILR